jgi:hypothetical protein
MEPGSLPIGRLAPQSWSNMLGGSLRKGRMHMSNVIATWLWLVIRTAMRG